MARRPPRGTAAGEGKLIGHARLESESGAGLTDTPVRSRGPEGLGDGPDRSSPSAPSEPAGALTPGTSGELPVDNPGHEPGPGPEESPGDTPPTVAPVRRRRRRRRSTGERVVRWAALIVAIVLVTAGSVYGYLWYRLGEIKSVKCSACAVESPGAPYNVLIVGSDSRVGDTGAAAKAFGSASLVGGQRSDTIKILHVDPATSSARLMSIPRDTYVELSGMPPDTGLASHNKINTAFNSGPGALIQTIENTFGIPINHFVITSFSGVIDLVKAVGGINLNFPYPVRDNDQGNNNSGLDITHAGCQTLDGNMALALARSRYYEYEVRRGYWEYDGSGDLGRIQRQNVIIEAVIDKAKSSYNPLTVNAFLGSIVHDITKDDAMSTSMMLSLAQRYHAFSGSALETFTIPTLGASSSVAGSIEVVQQPAASELISQFLGTSPEPIATPPLNAYGSPVTVPPTTTTTTSRPSSETGGGQSVTTTTVPGTGPFNPTPC
ncbi:MAG TPA: LCP family protein [Acidimicrobiales bacterium]|nr:LCP family protein [Acidimicrobiales bacterium]